MFVVDGAFQERLVECHVLGRGLSAEGGMWVVAGIGRVGGVNIVSGVIALILFRIIFNIAAAIFDIAAVLIQLRVAWFRRSNERYELVTRKESVQYVRRDVYYRTLRWSSDRRRFARVVACGQSEGLDAILPQLHLLIHIECLFSWPPVVRYADTLSTSERIAEDVSV